MPSHDRANTESSPPPAWHVHLLGGLRLRNHATEVTRLPSRAVAVLLARLALAPRRAHAREELIESMWPGVELDVGRNRLRQALSTLKSILEPAGALQRPVLQADRTHVRVVADSLWCDACDFERLARGGQLREALALYTGELLPGFYDEWIDEERARLAALHDRLVRAAPLAAPPAIDTAAPLGANATAPARVLLPSYVSRMFGAEVQARRLRDLVLTRRLVTLLGPGGAGKTRLAIEVAHSLREHSAWPLPAPDPAQPFDLIAFVPLVACTNETQLLDALLAILQIAPGAETPLAALVGALADRRALLVLDNVEQLVDTAGQVVAILASRLPLLHLLVTSRRALGIDGEQELALAALEVPAPDAGLEAAAANPALALFVERARAVRADFHLSARNAPTLVALARALEGMPLAIELAAARVRTVAPAEMLERLRGEGTPRLDLLARSGPRAAGDPRHASMQRVIAWSWERLAPDQARLLGALTVFSGTFTAASAAALVAGEPLDALLLLDDLVAHSLVQALDDAAGDDDTRRFSIYQPVREFVLAQADATTLRHWRARLRRWALDWSAALPRTPPLPAVRAEMPNLVAALAGAHTDGASGEAVELLLNLRRTLEDIELPAEGIAHAIALVEACPDPLLQARGHALLGPVLFTAGQGEAALRHGELGVRRDLLDDAALARALHALARVRWRSRRRVAEVEPLLDEAQRLVAPLGDREIEASLFALRAFIANQHFRDPATGERLHGEALARWEKLGNRHAVLSGRYNLAVVAHSAGRAAQALERIEPVLAEARALQDWRRLSQSLNLRGNALADLHRWREALADYQQCLRVAWQTMAVYDLAFGLWNLPRTLARLRRPEPAVRLIGFATAYWSSRFGALDPRDLRYLQRIRALAARQIDRARIEALWREGEQLNLAQAVALALAPID